MSRRHPVHEEQDLESFVGVVETRDDVDEFSHDRGFAVHGDHDGIEGQICLGNAERFLVRDHLQAVRPRGAMNR